MRHYSREWCEMLQVGVAKLLKNRLTQESTSEWSANCSVSLTNDRTVRDMQNFRRFNAVLKSQVRGIGNLSHIVEDMKGLKGFPVVDLASGF